mgnify:CR=1 FL=1
MTGNENTDQGITGIVPLSFDRLGETSERTVIVLGQARGGTSLAAGALLNLGLPMGMECRAPIYEDQPLTRAIRDAGKSKVREIIAQYNERWPQWGYKQPAVQKFWFWNHRLLRNPCYLLIVKDPISIADRLNQYRGRDTVNEARAAMKAYDRLLKFVSSSGKPALLVSYDKLYRYPDQCLPLLAQLTGIENPDLDKARAFCSAGGEDYKQFWDRQQRRNSTGVQGHVDRVSDKLVSGWAMMADHADPIEIQVSINDEPIMTGLADISRPSMVTKGRHPTGNCGFRIAWPKGVKPKAGDKVKISAGPDQVELARSPWVVEQ